MKESERDGGWGEWEREGAEGVLDHDCLGSLGESVTSIYLLINLYWC